MNTFPSHILSFTALILAGLNPVALAEDFPPSDDFAPASEAAVSDADKQQSERDRAEIGGRVRIESSTLFLKSQKFENAETTNGSGAEIYIDAKGHDGGRAFLRAQVKQPATTGSPSLSVDEAKLQLTLKESVFLTAGRQKIKFGAAKFFNPTDFLNQEARSPFELEDRRSGVDALKVHVPVGISNFYGIALTPQNQKLGNTGAYARAESAFSWGEVSLSTLEVKGKQTSVGADVSAAVGDFDIFAEGAFAKHARISTGFVYEMKLNDTDSMALTAEYHFNESGLTQKSDYATAIQSGTHRPLELAREYFAASLYLANPKALSKTTFLVTAITNISDSSNVLVPQIFYELTKDIAASLRVQIPRGESGTEFQLIPSRAQTTFAVEARF
jgi:hypothetical protein